MLKEKEYEFKEKNVYSEDNSKNLSEKQNIDFRNAEDETENFKKCTPEVQEVSIINTDISKTKFSNTNNNISINKNLDYVDRLIDKFNLEINFYEKPYKKAYGEMLKIIRNTLSTKSDIVVSGISVPFSKYFERFKSLQKIHFEYALNCYFKNIDRIVNFQSYILSLLYSSIEKVVLTCEEKILNLNSSNRNYVYDEVIESFFRKKVFRLKKKKLIK